MLLSEQQVLQILEQTARDYPRPWSKAHHEGDPERYDYIIIAGYRLFDASAGDIGLNWRRAVVGDLSMDGLSVRNPADGRYYFCDVIAGAGGPNPSLAYRHPFHDAALLRDSAGHYAPHGFVNPYGGPGYGPLRTHVDYGPLGTGNPNPGGGDGGGGQAPRTYTPLEALAIIEAHVGKKLDNIQINELVTEALRLGYRGAVTEEMLAQLKVYAERWRDPQQPTTVTVERAALEHILVELQHAAADIQRLLA